MLLSEIPDAHVRFVDENVENMRLQDLCDKFLVQFRKNRSYACLFVQCKFLNLANVLIQIILVNLILGGGFLTLWFDNWSFDESSGYINPLVIIFPPKVKCFFEEFGPTGEITVHDRLCVLLLTNLHIEIYTLLWYWFYGLVIIDIILLCCHLFMNKTIWSFTLLSKVPFSSKAIKNITKIYDFGDIFLLNMLIKNMNCWSSKKLIEMLSAKLDIAEKSLNYNWYKSLF